MFLSVDSSRAVADGQPQRHSTVASDRVSRREKYLGIGGGLGVGLRVKRPSVIIAGIMDIHTLTAVVHYQCEIECRVAACQVIKSYRGHRSGSGLVIPLSVARRPEHRIAHGITADAVGTVFYGKVEGDCAIATGDVEGMVAIGIVRRGVNDFRAIITLPGIAVTRRSRMHSYGTAQDVEV